MKMPNYSNYQMKVVGEPESIRELLGIMRYEDKERHMCRIFDATVAGSYDDEHEEYMLTETGSVIIYGDCAWSVYVCMFEGNHTYYDQFKDSEDFKGTTIAKESKRLGLDVEIFAREEGALFEEHYLISNGEIEVMEEKELDFHLVKDYENVDVFNKQTGANYTNEEFDKYHGYLSGGFEWEYTI